MTFLISLMLLGSSLLASVSAIPTITQKGAKLFTSDGKQFFNKGMAYQGTPDDPLVDVNQCSLDANLMKTLAVNSIRVYHVDPQLSHDACMKVFADAGIYVWLDLDTFATYILQDNPQWTSRQFSAYAEVMDTFINYDNLAGFWIGNEIINSATGSPAAVYIKAAIADMKAYRNSKNYRAAPIGYSAADIAELRPMLQNYLACGDSSSAVEFFGLNSYEWCGPTNTFTGSGYSILQNMTQDYNTPIFFSETGCNVGGPRLFEDQSAILGPDMNEVWSGAIIYEWVQETNNYGMVSYANGLLSGTPTAIAPDFTNLSKQWATLSPTGISSTAYTPSLSAPACPGSTAGGWLVNGNPSLPTLGVAAVTSRPLTNQPGATSTSTPAAVVAVTTGNTGPSASHSSSLISSSIASTTEVQTSDDAVQTVFTSVVTSRTLIPDLSVTGTSSALSVLSQLSPSITAQSSTAYSVQSGLSSSALASPLSVFSALGEATSYTKFKSSSPIASSMATSVSSPSTTTMVSQSTSTSRASSAISASSSAVSTTASQAAASAPHTFRHSAFGGMVLAILGYIL